MHKKKIIFCIKQMSGGGAERVLSLLASAMQAKGFDVKIVLTHQKFADADTSDITDINNIEFFSLLEKAEEKVFDRFSKKILLIVVKILLKIGTRFSGKIYDRALALKYLYNNYSGITCLKRFYRKNKNSSVVAFLYDSMFYSLLAKNRNIKLVISERADPCQYLNHRTNRAFIINEFQKADAFVFQSPDVKNWYNENTSVKGQVIFNPVKSDLPEPYFGSRKSAIVNFCRISSQKNLILLVDAFEKFHRDFPDYELHIFGDSVGNNAEGYAEEVKDRIKEKKLDGSVNIFPSRKDIHSVIRDYGMFVSSSDFEGMSNSMLEAMALGLPCVCTDCPAGGARAVIKDGENGLLVPVNDSEAMYRAMKQVIESPELAEKLSHNAVKIREDLSVEKIIDKWMEIIDS